MLVRRVSVRVWITAATAGMVLAGFAGAVSATATPNPKGNNGTVKIDGAPFDNAPDNEPHVGCQFQVDFYGYDKGDLDARVTFTAHPPTLPASSDRVLRTDSVFIGQDDNSGGGSTAGLDASRTYRLDFTGIEPHPKQGFHVKLTVNAEGSQGADVKHKVFWVAGCESPGPSPTHSPSPSHTPSPTHSPSPSHTPSSTHSPSTSPSPTPSPSPSVTPSPSDSSGESGCTSSSSTTDLCETVSGQPAFTG
jgi:hypothetical protein